MEWKHCYFPSFMSVICVRISTHLVQGVIHLSELARPVCSSMECTYFQDWFFEFFKIRHSESSVQHFEAIQKSGV